METIKHLTGVCGESHLNIFTVSLLIFVLVYVTIKQLIKNSK